MSGLKNWKGLGAINNMLKAVIFDFDGVITDSEILHLRGFNKVLAQYNVEIKKKDYYTKYLGYTDFDCFKIFIQEGLLKIDKKKIAELVEQKDHIFKELAKTDGRTIEGVREFLELLEKNHIPMAICSGALLTEIELILDEAKLRPFFQTIVSAEHVKKGKPHPEGFLRALKRLNRFKAEKADSKAPIAAKQCVVIEDSIWGLQAAKAAGMHSVAVTNSYEAQQLSIADKIVDNLKELRMEDLQKLCT
jgi:beta-phosphoglucomutase